MINSLIGQISAIHHDTIHLQMGALEWQLQMSTSAVTKIKLGEERRIYTYLQHKEDSMQLFGFIESNERDLFLNLIKVDGIGPKAALKILGYFTPSTFQEALNAPDAKLLAKAPGLGTKTAQKVLLALKGKLDLTNTSLPTHDPTLNDELVQPLVSMGFDRKIAAVELANVRKELGESAGEAEILRKTITRLS